MATITVFQFDTPTGAEQMLGLVQQLSDEQLITVQDAATVTWPQGKQKPKTKHLDDMTGAGALAGAFWGMLFGLLFFIPLFGMAVGAAMGALAGKFSDYGIDKDFIKSVSEKVTEGTSALFLMTSNAVMDKVTAAIKQQNWKFEIVSTNLTQEQETKLRQDFGTA